MINNKKILFTVLVAACVMASDYGQRGLLGSAGTWCRDGWKFSASYYVEPALPHGPHISIAGWTDVMHTDAKDGRPDTFHRFFVDPEAQTYWGYDVEVEPTDKIGIARLRFKPFTLRADQLPKEYHTGTGPIRVPNIAEFRALPSPQVPAKTFQSGQAIAVDVLTNAATGQKVVDYMEVSYEPTSGTPSQAEARDFQVSDVLLHMFGPSLRVNGAEFPQGVVADRGVARKLIWLSVPGHGRFLFSVSPYAGYGFQKSGVVSGFRLSFSWNGERYELTSWKPITESSGSWNLYVLAAPLTAGDATAQGYSFGAANSVEEFLSMTQ